MVSSGAVAAGREVLGLPPRRIQKGIPYKQMLAAVGQNHLMRAWTDLFRHLRHPHRPDPADPRRPGQPPALPQRPQHPAGPAGPRRHHDHQRERHRGRGRDPHRRQRQPLGPGDRPGGGRPAGPAHRHRRPVHRRSPHRPHRPVHPRGAAHRRPASERLAGRPGSDRGVGGMVTKIQAARLATQAGVAVVIANGSAPDILVRLAGGERLGTLFTPRPTARAAASAGWPAAWPAAAASRWTPAPPAPSWNAAAACFPPASPPWTAASSAATPWTSPTPRASASPAASPTTPGATSPRSPD